MGRHYEALKHMFSTVKNPKYETAKPLLDSELKRRRKVIKEIEETASVKMPKVVALYACFLKPAHVSTYLIFKSLIVQLCDYS